MKIIKPAIIQLSSDDNYVSYKIVTDMDTAKTIICRIHDVENTLPTTKRGVISWDDPTVSQYNKFITDMTNGVTKSIPEISVIIPEDIQKNVLDEDYRTWSNSVIYAESMWFRLLKLRKSLHSTQSVLPTCRVIELTIHLSYDVISILKQMGDRSNPFK